MNTVQLSTLDDLTDALYVEEERHLARGKFYGDEDRRVEQTYWVGQAMGIRRANIVLQRKYVELCASPPTKE